MFQNLRRLFPNDVYVLIGSQHTYVAAREGKVFRIPSRILVKKKTYEVVAFGDEAREVEHAGLAETAIIIPYTVEEILDEAAAVALLRSLFRVVLGSGFFLKPRVWLGLSHRVSPFMRELWQSVAISAGARELITVDQLLAGAAGAELDISAAHGYAIAHVSEQSVDLGLVSFRHVQVAHGFHVPDDQWSPRSLEVWREGWKDFTSKLPSEFAATILQEGLVIFASESQVDRATALTKALNIPVTMMQRSVTIPGMRSLAHERMELS